MWFFFLLQKNIQWKHFDFVSTKPRTTHIRDRTYNDRRRPDIIYVKAKLVSDNEFDNFADTENKGILV